MDKKIYLDKVLEYLIKDKNIEIPDSLNDKRKLWSELVSSNDYFDVPDDILLNEDKFLRLDLMNRKITDAEKLKTIDVTLDSKIKHADKIALWQGDITTIYADLLVNSTTKDVIGCGEYKRGAIDSSIFMRSGMRLRKKCKEIMNGGELEVSEILITRAYNLPSDFIIHVVTPKVDGELTLENKVSLEMCYRNILECAKNNMAKTLVIPCIGVGFNNFPKQEAMKIAVDTVTQFLDKNDKLIDKVVFDVMNDNYFDMYATYLSK